MKQKMGMQDSWDQATLLHALASVFFLSSISEFLLLQYSSLPCGDLDMKCLLKGSSVAKAQFPADGALER
jgi:hypothetical protein